MTLVFCGTPAFAVPTLEKLVQAGHRVRLVVTQPDRPRGRGLKPAASPVKLKAQELGLPVAQPERIKNNAEFRNQLEALRPDAIVVVGYGRIIPEWMLGLPRYGNINLHASLLPRYRGAAPIQWAIANGEKTAGVTTMCIDEGLDTGDILLQREVAIAEDETAQTLAPWLAVLGADLMVETLHGLAEGTITPRPQDDSQATLAPLLKKEDGRMDFTRSARELCDRLRGFTPWPGAFTTFRGKTLHVVRARVREGSAPGAAGEMRVQGGHLLIACGGGSALELLEVQPEGKKSMLASDFLHGYRPRAGERLGA
jgi:methionyl-tRNA formyltransferase